MRSVQKWRAGLKQTSLDFCFTSCESHVFSIHRCFNTMTVNDTTVSHLNVRRSNGLHWTVRVTDFQTIGLKEEQTNIRARGPI